jgi:hypothetical protein
VRGSNPLGAVAPLPRSNRHLHHRLADACASTTEWARWGTGDIGVSDVNASSCLAEEPEPATQQPCKAASTVRDSKGGIRTRSFPGAKYPKSSPPALVEPQDAANQITKKGLRRSERRRDREPCKVRSAIGIRLAPRSLRQAPRF